MLKSLGRGAVPLAPQAATPNNIPSLLFMQGRSLSLSQGPREGHLQQLLVDLGRPLRFRHHCDYHTPAFKTSLDANCSLGKTDGGGAKKDESQVLCWRNGWKAHCESAEVDCMGFVGQPLHWVLRLLRTCGWQRATRKIWEPKGFMLALAVVG